MKNRSNLRWPLYVAVLAACLTAAPLMISAQTLDCKCVSLMDPDDHHLFSSGGDRAYRCDTAGCHTSAYSQLCSSEHSGCGLDFAMGQAAEIGDAMRTLKGATSLAAAENVVYNHDRQALQVVSCNGMVIASARVPAAYVFAVIQAFALKYV